MLPWEIGAIVGIALFAIYEYFGLMKRKSDNAVRIAEMQQRTAELQHERAQLDLRTAELYAQHHPRLTAGG